MDLYLSGTKGLAALQSAIQYPQNISAVRIAPDSGVVNDPYQLMLKIIQENKLNLITTDAPIVEKEALAVGWKFLIKGPYERLFVIHDSLLPKYRGWNPLVTALQNKDQEIGVTLLLADEQIDHGPIVRQERISVVYPIKIADAIMAIETEIRVLVAHLMNESDRTSLLLEHQNEDSASYSIWRNEDDYRINWEDSAENILAFINSVSFPYKGAMTTLNGKNIRIFDAKEVPDLLIINRTPGKFWKIENRNPTIVCGIGLIEILEYRFENELEEFCKLDTIRSKFV
jgi:methionyl-tRNA formyltransferase